MSRDTEEQITRQAEACRIHRSNAHATRTTTAGRWVTAVAAAAGDSSCHASRYIATRSRHRSRNTQSSMQKTTFCRHVCRFCLGVIKVTCAQNQSATLGRSAIKCELLPDMCTWHELLTALFSCEQLVGVHHNSDAKGKDSSMPLQCQWSFPRKRVCPKERKSLLIVHVKFNVTKLKTVSWIV